MMNPLESPWFFRMVESEAKAPVDRLLAVFRVTANWMAAPGIRDALVESYASQGSGMHAGVKLKEFLSGLAVSAGVEKPDVLASHLVILLQCAIAEELRDPEQHAMAHAAHAARAVIAQSRAHIRRRRLALLSAGGIAATVLATVMGWQLLMPFQQPAVTNTLALASGKALLLPTGISPSDMEAVLALHEQLERGVCPAPQLLALPPGQMTAYMNVINFRSPENPVADRENIKAFLAWYELARARECYFAPKNGHTTVAWTKG